MAEHTNGNDKSADTTPTYPRSMSSGERIRSDDEETLVSNTSAESEATAQSVTVPAPPVNSPQTQSLAGETHAMDLTEADQKLENIPGSSTQPGSHGDIAEGKAHLRAGFRSELDLFKQLFKKPPRPPKPPNKKRRVTKRPGTARAPSDRSPPNEHVHENSIWLDIAVEDVFTALKRLAVAAQDLSRLDNSKSVADHYSEVLADVIKKGEIGFDSNYLQ
ncbi:hypothetical protein LTR37_019145 [Vermiconidia calcicola]|uniref:Uncharacterized protein n=1 Tax=Vermiconidia calcicola TaxID=1690605 RepID=A0ACC3MGT7_9PEZI|nr:hypothetical protein LTR37_019145 [Vermiconidia calcicola]